jgi:hypothetical protein
VQIWTNNSENMQACFILFKVFAIIFRQFKYKKMIDIEGEKCVFENSIGIEKTSVYNHRANIHQ